MKIIISNSSPDPIYEQIIGQIKQQILGGILIEGAPLPSIRKLARDLHISVITTKRAYDELEREGFIDTVGGKGSFVAAQNQSFIKEKMRKIVEEKMAEAITQARLAGIDPDELKEMLDLLSDSEEQ